MSVALGTPHGQPHPNLDGRIDPIFNGCHTKLFVIRPPFIIRHRVAMKRSRNDLVV